MVVAIDGPAGVGKSTLAQWVSDKYGLFNLNSGSFYRAMAVKILDDGVDANDSKAVAEAAKDAEIELIDGRIHLNGMDIENRLRTDHVDQWSSIISTIVPVRHVVNEHLRRVAGTTDLVAEGRDMTTVVFPDAEVKIFLDADPAVRAKRRLDQGTSDMTLEELVNSIRERDRRDRNKSFGALRVAEDAVVVDTSALTLEEVYDKVSGLIETYL